jgi:hypothetical protein
LKKILVAFAICFTATILLSTVTVTSVAAQPIQKNSSPLNLALQSQVICAAHWTEDVPVSGGWIFASLVRETGYTDKAWLYVSGFHPAGAAGSLNTTYSAAKRVSLDIVDEKLSVCTNMKFDVTSGDGAQSTAWHTVDVNWSLSTVDDALVVQDFGSHRDTNALLSNWLNGIWTDTDADISINIGDSKMHKDFSCSDWATVGLLSPQQVLTLGHWIVDEPKAGGWVFAAAGKNTINNKAWVMVAGYHPTGVFGISMPATFHGVNSDVYMKIKPGCINIPFACINFEVHTFVQGPIIKYEDHDVSLDSDMLCARMGSDWRAADMDISINTRGDDSHSTFWCADFAMIDFDLPCRR